MKDRGGAGGGAKSSADHSGSGTLCEHAARNFLKNFSENLGLVPISLRAANEFVSKLHRHHKATAGHKFSIAVTDGENIRGVAIVGRPVSRHEDDGLTIEVNRVCTDGAANACSMLYGAARRAAKAMGYRRAITYTLPGEGGVSLKASGWKLVGLAGGGSWNREKRARVDKHPTETKWKWETVL